MDLSVVEARKPVRPQGLFRSIMVSPVLMDVAELVTIGKILKPFGIKGEVRVQSLSDVPGRWEAVEDVMLVTPSGHTCESKVRHRRGQGEALIIAFEGFSTPEEAARFRGALIKVPRSDVAPVR